MKKTFEKALRSRQEQRAKNASRTLAEKFKTLDRLREGSELLRRAKYAQGGRKVR